MPTNEQDSRGRRLLAKLAASYLYPKDFLENGEQDNNYTEGAVASSFDFDEWLPEIENNLDNYYGQFVTRLLIDHASLISPYDRFMEKKNLFNKFFNIKNKGELDKAVNDAFHFDEDFSGGGVIVDTGMTPIQWVLAALDKTLNAGDKNYPQWIFDDDDFSLFADSFISQLNICGNKKNLIHNFCTLSYLLSEGDGQEEFLSESLKTIYSNHSIGDYYQFCDLVLFHQLIELLFRQVSTPFHVNIEKTRRWKYTAKETPMYMDMLVLDECRYLYDWMPTADMFSSGMSDIERQLAYRFALDGVAKHRRWYNPEFFFGTAIVDQYTKPFKAKTLSPRVVLNP